MFEQLFTFPVVVAHHRKGPLLEERIAFLTHLTNHGCSRKAVQRNARRLLVVAEMLGVASQPRKALTLAQVKRAIPKQCRLSRLATRWLQFTGRLQQARALLTPCAKKIKAFADYMKHEAELSPLTIYGRCCWVRRFFDRLRVKEGSLHGITPPRIDMVLQRLIQPGGYSRGTIQGCATALRAFFRFAEAQGWCRNGLAVSIRSPRVFSQASLPLGPSWEDVRRLLAMTEGNQRHNIRARAILMLFAIYGLRAGEVIQLRLEDYDWEHEVFRVVSSKTGRVRTYPLTRTVGDAILRYLQEVRPRSSYREVFLSLASSLPAGVQWIAVGIGSQTPAILRRVASPLRASYPTSCLRHAIVGRGLVTQGDRRPTRTHRPQ